MSLSSVSQFVFCILHGVQYFLHFFIQFFFLCVFYTSIAFVWFVVVCEQTQCKRILGDLTKVLHELFKAARQKQQMFVSIQTHKIHISFLSDIFKT